MKTLINMQKSFYRKLPLLAGMCLCFYFTYHAMYGDRSYSKLAQLSQVAKIKTLHHSNLLQSSKKLEKKVAMMRPNSLSADMVDEQARLILGYYDESELIVFHR